MTINASGGALRDQVARVATLRLEADRLTAEMGRVRAAFEAEHADLIASASEARARVADEERRLRQMAVAEFTATGDLHPAPGIGIRRVTELDYDDAVAFGWAKEHAMALALDRKAFEVLAKSADLPFVTRREVPQATLARELGAVLSADALIEETTLPTPVGAREDDPFGEELPDA